MVDEEAPADRSSAAGSSATGGTEQVPPRDRSPSPLPFKRGAAEPNGVPLSFKRPERAAPRVDAGVPDTPRKAHERVAVPFTPITLVCRDLRYYVPDPSKGEAEGVVKGEADREIAGKLELLKGA